MVNKDYHYGTGNVGKCLGPIRRPRGHTKNGGKILWTYVSQSISNVLCIL